MPETASYRLPRSVDPERYEIEIAPDLVASTFSGRERIDIRVHEPVRQIVLNAADLTIASAVVSSREDREDAIPASVAIDPGEERLVLGFDQEIGSGEWRLEIEFAGTINDKLRGFYRSTFRDDQGQERVIATTQFEATDARRAFPCWDEPDRKAVFAVTLVIDDGLSAFSNSAELSRQRVGDGRTAIRFHETMRMSTYLVAFVVGPLEVTGPVEVDGVDLRVIHVPGRGEMCAFALEIGSHALRFFTAWFGIPYPGDKLDLIALPDFAFGAMENLGAVTFRESLLVVDPSASSQVELERVADVVSHEIAHMWFGDLVTMKWWNGLWLNEAFATFMEMLCTDDFRPEWHRWVTFGLSRATALGVDSLTSTRPIEFPVARPEEAEGMFDVLTYEKGAAVLRMLERYLGAEPFRQGIRRYLETHAHGNAETTDLWDAIEAATRQPARSIMDSWIFQEGYPLITASARPQGVALEQRRFLMASPPPTSPARPPEGGAGGTGGRVVRGRWSVPILLRASIGGREETRRVLLEDDSLEVDLGGKPEWLAANAGGWGFYRVRYDAELAVAIRSDLGRLDALELFNLVSDTWAAALAGLGGLDDLAELVRLLRGDEDPATWTVATAALDFLHRVADDAGRAAVESYVREVVGRPFAELGWKAHPGEPEKTGTLRATLLAALGTSGQDPEVKDRAARLHREFLADRNAADADLLGALVRVVAANGGPEEYQRFLDRFHHPATPQEELRYLYGLGGFQDPELVRRTLDLTLSEVRTQNAPFLISGLLANRVGGPLAWSFVKSRWDELIEKLPQNSIVRMLEGLTSLCTPDLAQDIQAFFSDHEVRSGHKTLEQILERLAVNTAFAERYRSDIADAFQ